MEKIKFVATQENHRAFSVELRKNVNNYLKENGLSGKGNYRMWLKTFTVLFLYLAPFVAIVCIPMSAWLTLLLVIVMGIGEAGIGMSVMHDAAHGAYSEKKWVNDLFAGTMVLLGSNSFNWLVQHNYLHHTFTNIYGYDPDIDTKAMIRLCDSAPIKKYHRFQHIYAFPFYGLMTLSKLISDLGQLLAYNKAGIIKERKVSISKELIKLILIKVIYFSVVIGLPFLFTGFSWWQILIGFFVLHIVAGGIMGTVFQMAHVVEGTQQPLPNSSGIIENEWSVHQLSTTSDFARDSKILSWYVGGLNFQIEHHLFPNVCHIHYPAIAPIVEATAKKYGLKYNIKPTFGNAFVSHVRRLRELGNRKIEPALQIM